MSTMRRRDFLAAAGLSVGFGPAFASTGRGTEFARNADVFDPTDWRSVRAQFSLSREVIHMATFLLASHPHIVAETINRYRHELDDNPADVVHRNFLTIDPEVRQAVARYTGGHPDHIALTDSTTMGLGLVYNSVRLDPRDEIIVGAHGHYSTLVACAYRQQRDGVRVREVRLYESAASATIDEIVSKILAEITRQTRVLALTWVHSSTGVKMPMRAIADALVPINQKRRPEERILLCVDGVHGFGNQRERVVDLGCDVFVAGTHKWMFGPRGTGIIWARPEAWERLQPVIPSFGPNYGVWLGLLSQEQVPVGDRMTPGGFHSFEHRWALPKAFEFHETIGIGRIHDRIVELNQRCKAGLAELDHITLHTPMDPTLSAGINCFEVAGIDPDTCVDRLREWKIVASSSPYRASYVRLAPGILNSEAEVDQCVRAVAALG